MMMCVGWVQSPFPCHFHDEILSKPMDHISKPHGFYQKIHSKLDEKNANEGKNADELVPSCVLRRW